MDHSTSEISEAMLTERFERCIEQRRWSRDLQSDSVKLRHYSGQLRSEIRRRTAGHRDAARIRAESRLTAAT